MAVIRCCSKSLRWGAFHRLNAENLSSTRHRNCLHSPPLLVPFQKQVQSEQSAVSRGMKPERKRLFLIWRGCSTSITVCWGIWMSWQRSGMHFGSLPCPCGVASWYVGDKSQLSLSRINQRNLQMHYNKFSFQSSYHKSLINFLNNIS